MELLLLDVGHNLDNDEQFERYLRLIPAEEAKSVRKFHFRRDEAMSLGARLLTRYYISNSTELAWVDIFVSRNTAGRPFSPQLKKDFNISHHAGYVLLGAAKSPAMIGVDLVKAELNFGPEHTSLSDFEDIFTVHELDLVRRAGSYSSHVFAQMWGLKEAFVKAEGTGLTNDLVSIAFSSVQIIQPDQNIIRNAAAVSVNDHARPEYSFSTYRILGDVYAVVAVRSPEKLQGVLNKLEVVKLRDIYDKAVPQ